MRPARRDSGAILRVRAPARALALLLACVLPTMATAAGPAPTTPEIRMTAANQVPRCVTPDRLMAYLKSRNASLDPRFADIAQWYRRHGEAWRVRWDYAFYQMAIETNFLTYKRGDGRMGDVDPRQNNFAGIGTTGGGVPGDRYGDVGTGVLAQIQHLVAYSGEKLAAPVAPRTQLKQDDIVSVSRKLNRPVRFGDLAGRWAVDRNYARSIEWVAEQFRTAHCKGGEIEAKPAGPATPQVAAAGKPKVARLAAAGAAPTLPAQPSPAPRPPAVAAPEVARPPPSPAAARSAAACTVASASYGGSRSVLIRSAAASGVRFTVLSVLPGFERSMTEGYIRKHLGEGAPVGEFESREAALARARELCAGA